MLQTLTEVTTPTYNTAPAVAVRLKPSLLGQVDDLVSETGATRSRIIRLAIEFYLQTLKTKNMPHE